MVIYIIGKLQKEWHQVAGICPPIPSGNNWKTIWVAERMQGKNLNQQVVGKISEMAIIQVAFLPCQGVAATTMVISATWAATLTFGLPRHTVVATHGDAT